MEIGALIENIKQSVGIKRIKYNADKGTCIKTFCEIANAMLDWRGKTISYDLVKSEIEALVDWAYMFGDTDLDYTKGILFKGGTGGGKTFLMKAFARFLMIDNMRFKSNSTEYPLRLEMVNARVIAGEYQSGDSGYDIIRKYATIPCLFIDDIGAEAFESVAFGNRLNVVSEILDRREENNLLTFGTTNIDKLSSQYDDRMISRMNNLFNVKSFTHNTDFRKL